jgi:hypothetical protein
MAINRNVARAIIFGPKRLGGMAICLLHTLQGIHIIQYFIGHIANNDGVGKLMRIFIEATQLEVGTLDLSCLPYTPSTVPLLSQHLGK